MRVVFFMRVSKSGLKKFKQFYQKRFGVELDTNDALRKARYILAIYEAIYGDPISKLIDDKKDEKSLYESFDVSRREIRD